MSCRGRKIIAIVVWALCGVLPQSLRANDQQKVTSMIEKLVVSAIPDHFSDRDNWGKTVEIFDGVKFRGKGLKVRAEKRTKAVNHGRWREFHVHLKNPERNLRVYIETPQSTGSDGFRTRITFTCPLHAEAREIHWSNGVKLLSISAEAEAVLSAAFDVEVKYQLSGKPYLPDIAVHPVVTDVELRLDNFDLKRIGRVINGDVAEELGRVLKRKILDRMLNKNENKVVEKANAELAKRQADFVLSPSKALSR